MARLTSRNVHENISRPNSVAIGSAELARSLNLSEVKEAQPAMIRRRTRPENFRET